LKLKKSTILATENKQPRIDIIVRDSKGAAFLYIELKSPEDYEKIKMRLLKNNFTILLRRKRARHKCKYLVLYTLKLLKRKSRQMHSY